MSYMINQSAGVDVGTVGTFSHGIPDGFLECDGATINRALYAKLFEKIGVIYGAGNGSTTFDLPDYRGMFLRGLAGGSGSDPDRNSRTNRGDGSTGDSVGTRQANEISNHRHLQKYVEPATAAGGPHIQVNSSYYGTNYNKYSSYVGGNETRPININVIYGIKY
jgi:microcystin-dependent protein